MFSSKRFLTDQMFYKDAEHAELMCEVENNDLLQCENCRVVVHKSCYEENDNFVRKADQTHWYCSRCFQQSTVSIRMMTCRFCELRGGALVEASDTIGFRSFVHVICAIVNPEVAFSDPKRRKLINDAEKHAIMKRFKTAFKPSKCEDPSTSQNWLKDISGKAIDADFLAIECTSNSEGCNNENSTLNLSPRLNHSAEEFKKAGSSNDKNKNSVHKNICQENADHSTNIHVKKSQSPETFPSTTTKSKCLKRRLNTQRFECEVCKQQGECLIPCVDCAEAGVFGTTMQFHITCAPLADLVFERRHDAPYFVGVCKFHQSNKGMI